MLGWNCVRAEFLKSRNIHPLNSLEIYWCSRGRFVWNPFREATTVADNYDTQITIRKRTTQGLQFYYIEFLYKHVSSQQSC